MARGEECAYIFVILMDATALMSPASQNAVPHMTIEMGILVASGALSARNVVPASVPASYAMASCMISSFHMPVSLSQSLIIEAPVNQSGDGAIIVMRPR